MLTGAALALVDVLLTVLARPARQAAAHEGLVPLVLAADPTVLAWAAFASACVALAVVPTPPVRAHAGVRLRTGVVQALAPVLARGALARSTVRVAL